MANWKQFTNSDGKAVWLNLDLAIRIINFQDRYTWVGFVKGDGIENISVQETVREVAEAASGVEQ